MTTDLEAQALAELDEILDTSRILLEALRAADSDKAHEAVTVMLHQVIAFYRGETKGLSQVVPMMAAIQTCIASEDLDAAGARALMFDGVLAGLRASMARG